MGISDPANCMLKCARAQHFPTLHKYTPSPSNALRALAATTAMRYDGALDSSRRFASPFANLPYASGSS